MSCVSSQCSWSQYSPWSPCSTTCGEGLQARTRHLLQPASQCEDKSQQFRGCFLQPCNTNLGLASSLLCLWSSWGDWSGCSVSCGGGSQQRFRVFLVGQGGREGRALDQDRCEGGETESRPCRRAQCPPDLQSPPAQCCPHIQLRPSSANQTSPYTGDYTRTLSRLQAGRPLYVSNHSQPRYVHFVEGEGWRAGIQLGNTNLSGQFSTAAMISPCYHGNDVTFCLNSLI